MTTRYWLRCACGRQVAVEATQAGETIPCACGNCLSVPTLRELSQSVPIVSSQAKPIRRKSAFWDRRHARVFLGGLVLLGALGAWATLEWLRPRPIDLTRLPPVQVWAVWQNLRQGPERNLTPAERYYVDQQGLFRTSQMIVLTCGAGGLLWMAFGYVLPGRRAK